MYFYTDLKGRDGNGLAGVNVNNGRTECEIRLSDLDDRFVTDEVSGVMYVRRLRQPFVRSSPELVKTKDHDFSAIRVDNRKRTREWSGGDRGNIVARD